MTGSVPNTSTAEANAVVWYGYLEAGHTVG